VAWNMGGIYIMITVHMRRVISNRFSQFCCLFIYCIKSTKLAKICINN
jgi:hypothetical protein